MKKQSKNLFGALYVGVAALSTPYASGGEGHTHHEPIEEVITTVPLHKTDAQTALPVTVLNGDELRNKAVSSIGGTLGDTPGMSNASFGPSVGQPVIRGQQGPRVTVLQNGTSSADASNVSSDHAVSVEPVLAESIEVLRGPSTLLYGGGAIGGVVNVIDKRIPEAPVDEITGAVELRHGSVNDESVGVFRLSGGNQQVGFYVDGLSRQTNNINIPDIEHHEEEGEEEEEHDEESLSFLENTDSEQTVFTFGASVFTNNGFFGAAIRELENEYGIPPGGHGHHDDEGSEGVDEGEHDENIRIDLEQTRIDFRSGHTFDNYFIESVRSMLTFNDYEHAEIEGDGEVGTVFSNEGEELRLEIVHTEVNKLHGAFGLQLKQSEFSAVGEESFIPAVEIENIGMFFIEDLHLDNAIFEFGVRADSSAIEQKNGGGSEEFSSWSYSASYLHNLDESFRIGLALSSAERAPITEELLSNDGNSLGSYVVHGATGVIEVGSTLLDTENSQNIDVSFVYESEIFKGSVTIFHNSFDNYIVLENSGLEQDDIQIFNYVQADATFDGLEFEVDVLNTLGSNQFLHLSLFGDYIDGEIDRLGNVPRLPPVRLGAKLTYEWGHLTMFTSLLHADDQDEPGLNEAPTEGYDRWNLGVNYQLEMNETEWLAFLKVKNITNEEIRSSVSFLREVAPEPGRSIEAGIRVSF